MSPIVGPGDSDIRAIPRVDETAGGPEDFAARVAARLREFGEPVEVLTAEGHDGAWPCAFAALAASRLDLLKGVRDALALAGATRLEFAGGVVAAALAILRATTEDAA